MPFTIRSTHRVSQLPTGRGTMTVPMTLLAPVRTSSPPMTAATTRAASGITMAISPCPGGRTVREQYQPGAPPDRAVTRREDGGDGYHHVAVCQCFAWTSGVRVVGDAQVSTPSACRGK